METNNLLKQALQKANVKSNDVANPDPPPSKQDVESKQEIVQVTEHKQEIRTAKTKETSWKHFSLTCSTAIVDKVHGIADKEGFSLREIVELFLQRGIDDYERKHGKLKPSNKDINNLL